MKRENVQPLTRGPLIDPAYLRKLDQAREQFARKRRILIKNLPNDVNEKELKETFLCGLDIAGVKLENNKASILFSNINQADNAVMILKKQNFGNYNVTIDIEQPDSLLFVGNLPTEFSEEQFQTLMSQYGSIERIFLVRSEVTGESKGYGFVEYSNKELAEQAKQQLMNTGSKYIGGRILRVDFAEPNLHTYNDLHSKSLFVDKLPRDFTNGEILRQLFSQSGTVTFAKVAVNPHTSASRGFAFVDYATVEEAERGQKAHNGTQIEGSNIRVAYGTPGRTGASILVHMPSSQVATPVAHALIQPGSAIMGEGGPRWPLQQMNLASPHPLMARPLMVSDPSLQPGLPRGPGPGHPAPLMHPASSVQMLVGSPGAGLLPRPIRGIFNSVLGIGPPHRPHMGSNPSQGPRPLMDDIQFRGPVPRPGNPRVFIPRGMVLHTGPRCPVPRNGPIRPLMDLSSNGAFPSQQHEVEQVAIPQGPGMQPMNQQIHQPQQPQPLMQPPSQQPLVPQHQQQRFPHQQLIQNPQEQQQIPQRTPQPLLPQPLMQELRPMETRPLPVRAPQPLLAQPIVGPGMPHGSLMQQHIGTPVPRNAVPGIELSFAGQGQNNLTQGQPVSGPVPLLGPGNGSRPGFSIPGQQPLNNPTVAQGQYGQAVAPFPGCQVPSGQPSGKLMTPQPLLGPMHMTELMSPAGPKPLMALPTTSVWSRQQSSPFANGSQRPISVPVGQVDPGHYTMPAQPVAPRPLMSQPEQNPYQYPGPQAGGVPRIIAQDIPYPSYITQQTNVVEQPPGFIPEQVNQGYQPTSHADIQQGIQPQQLVQEPPQTQIYQQPMVQVSSMPGQWIQSAAPTQQTTTMAQGLQVQPGQGAGWQVQPGQPELIVERSGQQWQQQQHQQPIQPQTMYSQFSQQQLVEQFTAQQFDYQGQQVSASNTSSPSPAPQHSAAPVMYKTQTPSDNQQHGQKRAPDQLPESYLNPPPPLMQGMGDYYDNNKRPRY